MTASKASGLLLDRSIGVWEFLELPSHKRSVMAGVVVVKRVPRLFGVTASLSKNLLQSLPLNTLCI